MITGINKRRIKKSFGEGLESFFVWPIFLFDRPTIKKRKFRWDEKCSDQGLGLHCKPHTFRRNINRITLQWRLGTHGTSESEWGSSSAPYLSAGSSSAQGYSGVLGLLDKDLTATHQGSRGHFDWRPNCCRTSSVDPPGNHCQRRSRRQWISWRRLYQMTLRQQWTRHLRHPKQWPQHRLIYTVPEH